MRPENIKDMIAAGLECEYLDVQGEDGTHFEAVIVSSAFEGKSLIEQHKLVYGTLGDNMKVNIHALSMKTLTPQQWQEQNK